MKLSSGIALLVIAAIASTPQGVAAADVKAIPGSNGGGFFFVVGDLEKGDAQKFKDASDSFQKGVVFFNSIGGNLEEGLLIGEQIRKKGFVTAVAFKDVCASACALAWLAGTSKAISPDAHVGFHAAYTMNGDIATETGPGNALIGAYLNKLGISYKGIVSLTSASPDDIHWLTERDSKSLSLNVAYDDAGEYMMNKVAKGTLLSVTLASLAASPAHAQAPLSRAVQVAYDQGFHDCARAADNYVKYVHTDESEYAPLTLWGKTNPNRSSMAAITSQAYKDGNATTTFTAVKNGNGKCDITFTQIIPSQQSCVEVRENVFKGWHYYGDLAGSTVLDDNTETTNVVLVNLPNNQCLVVKHVFAVDLNP